MQWVGVTMPLFCPVEIKKCDPGHCNIVMQVLVLLSFSNVIFGTVTTTGEVSSSSNILERRQTPLQLIFTKLSNLKQNNLATAKRKNI